MKMNMCYCMRRWFYGDITSDHAKQILMQAGKHGSFLVRNRQSIEHQYALSVRLDDNVHHVIVVYEVSQLTHTDSTALHGTQSASGTV